jgi:hypothetical protein
MTLLCTLWVYSHLATDIPASVVEELAMALTKRAASHLLHTTQT